MAKTLNFRLAWTKAWVASLVIVIVSVTALVATHHYAPDGLKPILSGIFSTLLGAGAIALTYDVFLRRTYTSELVELMGISDNLYHSGIQRVSQESEVAWAGMLGNATSATFLLIDAATMAEREWHHVLQASRERDTDVRVFLPSAKSPLIQHYADRRGVPASDVANGLTRTRNMLENGWKNAYQFDSPIRKKSKLRIFETDTIINTPMVFIDNLAIVLIPQSQRREAGQGMLALQFNLDLPGVVSQWLSSQRKRLEETDLVPSYESPAIKQPVAAVGPKSA